MSNYCQMSDAELEQFSLGRMAAADAAGFEEHLLICEFCRRRVTECDEYTKSIRSAAAQSRAESPGDKG